MFKKTFLALVFSVLFLWGGHFESAYATTCGENFIEKSGVCIPSSTGLSDMTVSEVLMSMLSWLLYITGTIGIIAFVVSGMMYLTSAGNDKMIENAKTYMVWSIVGIIVAFSGVIVLNAVANLFEGSVTF